MKKVFTGKCRYKNLEYYEKFVILIVIATLPLIIGALLSDTVEFMAGNSRIIGALLIVNAVILLFTDKIKTKEITAENAKPRNALIVGLVQLIAVVPGISRSGMTITGGLLNGFTREFAVKFSFILSIPAILGASVFHFRDFVRSGEEVTRELLSSSIIGFLFSFVFGFAAIIALRFIAEKRRFWMFSIWCAAVGITALILG
jgi:undecaprenyl-diphosphatase